jgi:hypothetical protein
MFKAVFRPVLDSSYCHPPLPFAWFTVYALMKASIFYRSYAEICNMEERQRFHVSSSDFDMLGISFVKIVGHTIAKKR